MSELVEVAPFRDYSEEDLRALDQMMEELDPAFNKGADEAHLRTLIESPLHEQFGARLRATGELVGALSVGIMIEPAVRYGYMGGVVASSEVRGMGVGKALLTEGVDPWARDHGLKVVEFVTEADRSAAVRLYEEYWGAKRVTDGLGVRNGILYNKIYDV